MKQDNMDIPAYFRQHMNAAPKNSRKPEVLRRALEALARGGALTMDDLRKTDHNALFDLFIVRENGRVELDSAGYDLARKMQAKYSSAAHKEELLAAGEVLIEEYFLAHAPRDAPKGAAARASSVIRRDGVETMRQLMEVSPEKLAGIRNMGEKYLAVALALREKFAAGNT